MPRGVQEIDLGERSCPGSINSEGLPNAGIDYYLSSECVDGVAESAPGKPYLVSLSGLKLKDNLEMLSRVGSTAGVHGIELNLACPNIPGNIHLPSCG